MHASQGLVALGAMVVLIGCGGDPRLDAQLVPEASVECGELTCQPDEICVETVPAYFKPRTPPDYACGKPPDGCDAALICDCAIESYGGFPVDGCSKTDEQTLFVIDATCGDRVCRVDEACLYQYQAIDPPPNGGFTPLGCAALPNNCEPDLDFCWGGCPEWIATAAGFDHAAGCFATGTSGVGVQVP